MQDPEKGEAVVARAKKPGRIRRTLTRALLLLLGVYVGFLIIINALLVSGGFAWLMHQRANVLWIQAGTSYSLWPGHFTLRNARIEVSDSNVHLLVEAPRGSLQIRLTDLLRQRFSAKNITGSELVIWLRPNARGQEGKLTETLPPLSDAEKPYPPTPTDRLWGIELESIDVHFRELWASDLRYQGAGTLRGGFALQPRVHAQVFPTRLGFEGGTLHRGEQALASRVHATLHASTPPVEISGIAPDWKHVSADVDLRTDLDDARPLGTFFPRLSGFRDGKGPLEVRLSLRRAQLVGDVRVKYHSANLRYEHRLFAANATASFRADANAADKLVETHAELHAATFRTRSKAELSLERFVIDLRFARDVAYPHLEHLATSGKVVSLDASALVDLGVLPSGLRVFGGRASGDFDAKSLGMGVVTNVRSQLHDLSIGTADWRIGVAGSASGTWTAPLDKPTSGELTNGLLDLRGLEVARPSDEVHDWKTRIAFPKLTVRADPLLVAGSFDAFAEDFRPALQLAGVNLPKLVDKIIGPQSLHVTGRTRVTRASQEVTIERSLGNGIPVIGRAVHVARGTYGAFLFDISPFPVGAYVSPDHSGISLLAGSGWLKNELAELPK